MKKYTQSIQYVQHMWCRARRAASDRLRFKRYLRNKHIAENTLTPEEREVRQRAKDRIYHRTILTAPDILSFVRNPEGVANFIDQLNKCFDRKEPVWVSLKDVKEIDYDGITVLLSVIVRFKAMHIPFNGDRPLNTTVRSTLEESKFFDYLYKSTFRVEDTYRLTGQNSIFTHAMRTVDSELGERIIESASQTVWGIKKRCPGIQRTFIELMQNTNNHASLDKEGDKHWWLSVKHIKEEHRVAFSFVDYGVGVFYNLRNKRQGNKFFGILERLRERFHYGNDAEVLKLIFKGELHRTASGKPFRGKGLPGVYDALQHNKLSHFAMITNNVFYHSDGEEYRILNTPFQGTFIYWELTKDNSSLTYETQDCV